ncbi:LRIG3 [Branchiostoma lanceolatum]|uniref:LRIG3 protein n=1 Tax=Branchiostoma lanceolatum TaxID=7740 RepID=A0A8K0EM00_BRALA|nr:LRIG3 [Branchiostoma lanceolatum]
MVHTLALIDADITDVENNTFDGFSRLRRMSLDSNRLTNVEQTWFAGLGKLLTLILSNNHIKQIDSGSFMHLTRLHLLNLENNLLQVVDPAWLFGLTRVKIMILGSNAIDSISPGSFRHLQLTWLDLSGNDLSCLDGAVFQGQSLLFRLHISSGMLSSVHDAKSHGMTWGLHRFVGQMRKSATLVVEVPKFLFCTRHNNGYEILFGWMFDALNSVPRNIEMRGFVPGKSCGNFERSLSTISIQAPVVVLVTDGSLANKPVPNTLEQCRQVWEYDGGIVVGLPENATFQLVSMATGNATFEGVAMSFVPTHTGTNTESQYDRNTTTRTDVIHDNTKNITCILLTKDAHMWLFFTIPQAKQQTHTTVTTFRTDTDHSTNLQFSTTPGPVVPPARDLVLIPVVVSAVVSLVVSSLVVLAWKVCASRSTAEHGGASDDAHIWTIPLGVAFPGLLRSASLPACSRKPTVASCRSLPAVLHSIEPTYCEIPDDVAAAHRPLPGPPHEYSEIPDDAISGVVRSASLPAVTCTRGGVADDAASCRSLPAVLLSIEPTYSEIPDHIAIAKRPLPALPRTDWEVLDHDIASQRPLHAPRHTYSEIPDEDSGPMPFYAGAAEVSLHVVTNRQQKRLAFRDNTTASSRPGRSFATYGSAEQTKAERNNFYRKAPEVQGIRARRNLRTGLVSQATDKGFRRYINVTDVILSRGQSVTEADIAFLTLPNTYWPWEIAGKGTRITPRRASLPLVTLPNTYWPWGIPGERSPNTPSCAPLSTLPNTYWPWEIPGERSPNTPSCAPLSTLPNTYWPWEIPGEGTRNTARRASLPLTLPNTYWPWEIPGDRSRNTPSCAPLSTLPNTYWPWEIPGEGTRNTARRASLPLSTLPNTYWPWEIPGDRSCNTPSRAPLSQPPNTYWPWEIPGEGTRNTARRASLPLSTLPNTYWPWEIPGDRSCNTPSHASLSQLPNTYWPWEIPGEETRKTSQRVSIPLVTLPNTYWPWEIPGEGSRNTARRASLPLVTPLNTYWPWEIPGIGNP